MTKVLLFLVSFILITAQNSESSQFYIPKPRTPAPAPTQTPPPPAQYTTPVPSPAPAPAPAPVLTPTPVPPQVPPPIDSTVAPPPPEEEYIPSEIEEVETPPPPITTELPTIETLQPMVKYPITPSIKNETSTNGERKYTPLFAFTNSQLKNEAMIFYAKLDPKTGAIDKYNPIVWRRVDKKGEILVPKTLQTRKIGLLFSPGTYLDNETLKFNLNFQLYKPGTHHSDKGVDVKRELIVKMENGLYEAYLTRGDLPPIQLKELYSYIHFRNLAKAIIGDPDGTNAYWVRVTAEDDSLEYVVPNNYKKHSKSIPQKHDPSYKRNIARIVNPDGIEIK
ncbi:MAG: hypothetical protein A3F16_04180 [Deltaproteobacteria bacterium RIFCSPHIGHO2_12_FULL_43_9]|nr:MAG: hypothetical protein A3F16_04180 [Deltaproteobacteria bacterium RIFCSPHIGHO2_12_FULL_43_9]